MASSCTFNALYGAAPRTERGVATYLHADVTHDRFAYCAQDHIVIRKISSPHECTVYRGHAEPTCIRFSHNGAYALSGDAHGTIKIWNTNDPSITRLEQQALAGPIRDVCWDPEDNRIMIVGEGRREFAMVLMVDGGSRIGLIGGFTQGCLSCDWRPARPFKMVVLSNDRKIGFWKGPPLKQEWNKEEQDCLAKMLRFSPDGHHLISVGSGKSIIMDGKTGDRKKELPVEHKGTITGVAWSADSKQVVTSSCDHKVKLWDLEAETIENSTRTITIGDGDMSYQQLGCAWMGDTIASVSLNGDINFINATGEDTEPYQTLTGLVGNVSGLAVVGEHVWAASTNDGVPKMCSYKVGLGAVARVTGDGPTMTIVGLSACSDDVLQLCMDGCLYVACGDASAPVYTAKIEGLEIPTKELAAGSDLVVAVSEHSLTVHRKSGGYAVASTLADLDYIPLQVAISADETVVAVGCAQEARKPKKIVLYNVDSDNLVQFHEIDNLLGPCFALAFSPDGHYLASGDGNREVRVYDATDDYTCLRENLQFNAGRVTCLAWHPDSEMVVSGDNGRNLVVTHIGNFLKPTMIKRVCAGPVSAIGFVTPELFACGDTTGSIYMVDFKKL